MSPWSVAVRATCAGALLLLISACAITPAPPKPTPSKAVTSLREGAFIREVGQTAIYIYLDGERRAFADPETFRDWGGKDDYSNVLYLSPADMAMIPVGSPFPKSSHP
jgi:hypothetical protein